MLLLILGGFITLTANALLQRWRYGREAIDKRCDEVERAAADLASLCRDYWLKPWNRPYPDVGLATSEIDFTMLATQARIVGLTQRIVGLNALVALDFEVAEQDRLLFLLADVLEQATGGNFDVRYRNVDFDRARGIEAAAADYVVYLRELATRRWAWGAFLRSLWQRLRRYTWIRRAITGYVAAQKWTFNHLRELYSTLF